MTPQRKYQDGDRVEVWRAKRDEWVPGTIFGFEERGGTWKYLIQLAGYMAMSPDDPNSWFGENELR